MERCGAGSDIKRAVPAARAQVGLVEGWEIDPRQPRQNPRCGVVREAAAALTAAPTAPAEAKAPPNRPKPS